MNAVEALSEYFGDVEIDFMTAGDTNVAREVVAALVVGAEIHGAREAVRWFRRPNVELGGRSPMEAAHLGDLAELAAAARQWAND